MITIMHVVDLPGPNHWLNGVADHHDRSRFRHLVANLKGRNELHTSLEARGIQTFELGALRRQQLPLATTRLAGLLRRERVDIVQTHTFDPTTVGIAAGKLARTPLTVLTRHHANFSTIFNKPIHRQIDRLHALTADVVWSPSHYIKRCMIENEQVPEDRITVIPHGFDFELMKPRLSVSERAALRASIGGDEKILIGTVARLAVEKGHEYLFRAVNSIVARRPNARFVMIGDGPRRGELERMVAELGIGEYVRFLGWRWDAWNLIEAMDLIAHPSLHEPFGIVYVESMALEKAVVTTSDSASPEIIDDGETGRIVPPRDPDAFAAAIVDLLADETKAARLGKLARQRVIQKFEFSAMMTEYEAWYVRWLARVRPALASESALRLC